MMKVKISYGSCKMYVLGLDMNCPLCGVMVASGTKHACKKPDRGTCCENGDFGKKHKCRKQLGNPEHKQ